MLAIEELFGERIQPRRLFWTASPSREIATLRPVPLSQQIGTGVEIEIGEVAEDYRVLHYPLSADYPPRKFAIGTTPSGAPAYSVETAHYLITRAPYTTGRVQVWQPNGITNTIQTATGYDNRTPAGLNGVVSLVHPRLVHAYTVYPPDSGKPIEMLWSSALAEDRLPLPPGAVGDLPARVGIGGSGGPSPVSRLTRNSVGGV